MMFSLRWCLMAMLVFSPVLAVTAPGTMAAPPQSNALTDQQAIDQGQALYAAMSPSQQATLLHNLPALMAGAIQPDVTAPHVVSLPGGLARTADLGGATSPAHFVWTAIRPPSLSGQDLDQDGLDDGFETDLANAYTPSYHVSVGEKDVFATFVDQPTLAILQLYSAVPPISFYRVTPLGMANGIGYLQIDYLTLWNQDDGLAISAKCAAMTAALGLTLDGLGGHAFDQEHSDALLEAPLVNGTYLMDVSAYKMYDYYTAAHEGVIFFDHSAYIKIKPPASPGTHIVLWLSRSKHSTYTANPDMHPIFQAGVIAVTYASIKALYQAKKISKSTYKLLMYFAKTVFTQCVVEHFKDQDASSANMRTNVGELAHPINAATWILDPTISAKLVPYWTVQ